MHMVKTPLYSDKHLSIFEDRIQFKSWVLPRDKKDVMISHVKRVSEREMSLSSGRLRISGTSNFRDWFHFDAQRPSKNKAVVLETDYKVYKRLWITPERHSVAFNILKKMI